MTDENKSHFVDVGTKPKALLLMLKQNKSPGVKKVIRPMFSPFSTIWLWFHQYFFWNRLPFRMASGGHGGKKSDQINLLPFQANSRRTKFMNPSQIIGLSCPWVTIDIVLIVKFDLLDLSKFLHGFLLLHWFVKIDTRISLLLHGFVKVILSFSRPLPNKTKLKFDQDFKVCWRFCFELNALNES